LLILPRVNACTSERGVLGNDSLSGKITRFR
jgi:hypothetical protein